MADIPTAQPIITPPWQDPHLWAKVITDLIAVVGVVQHYLPPQYGVALVALTHSLVAIDQIISGIQGK